MHAGALSQGNRYKNETIGPSAVKPKGEQLGFYGGSGEFQVPKEMTIEDIKKVIQNFAQAARRAKQAGFDGIEIHGANGYILDQFLTNYTNQRTIFANGKLHEPEKAEEIIKNSEADVITIGTGALANPNWVNKVQNDEPLNEFNPEKFLHPAAKVRGFEEELY
jgi:2,4-dienoyl-CoA reductase-like NADH-dependent reductase (Old Yellow Enzyme family)